MDTRGEKDYHQAPGQDGKKSIETIKEVFRKYICLAVEVQGIAEIKPGQPQDYINKRYQQKREKEAQKPYRLYFL